MQHGAYAVDIVAVAFVILEWTVYAVALEHTTTECLARDGKLGRAREILRREA